VKELLAFLPLAVLVIVTPGPDTANATAVPRPATSCAGSA
jgi:threonine/homoserine/homoserine lactone efflux protein